MLNSRLYRTCWLVAGVALVVALLTLEAPEAAPEPALPSALDGPTTLELAAQLAAIAPERPPGSAADQASARWVQGQLQQVPRGRSRVQVQELLARAGGDRVPLQNVYLALPAVAEGPGRAGILVVAPRDTPPGVAAGASSTAILLRLARHSATTHRQRPHLFVSTDGSTLGNAGMRWFLSRFSSFPLAAAIVIDAPGDAIGDRVHVWSAGRTDRQALGLARIAEESVTRAGGRPDGGAGLAAQALRLAVPQTFGEQGPAIAEDLPAVTLSGRAESPLGRAPAPTAGRLELAANAAGDLLGALDAAGEVPAPDAALAVAGQSLRPTIARLALLLLALPVIVLAVDAGARLRRARVRMGPGARALALRAVPPLAALAAAHLLVLAGLLPRPAAGAPPLPQAAGFGAGAGLGLALALAAGALAWLWARRRARRVAAVPAAEGAAALAALAALLAVLWLVSPWALVLALPAAHAALLATGARRRWHLLVLAALALAPVAALAVHTAGRLDANPLFALWYLLGTAAAGARGGTGVLLAALVGACVWALGSLALFRARKGDLALAAAPAPAGRATRRRRRRGARTPAPRPARPPEDRW